MGGTGANCSGNCACPPPLLSDPCASLPPPAGVCPRHKPCLLPLPCYGVQTKTYFPNLSSCMLLFLPAFFFGSLCRRMGSLGPIQGGDPAFLGAWITRTAVLPGPHMDCLSGGEGLSRLHDSSMKSQAKLASKWPSSQIIAPHIKAHMKILTTGALTILSEHIAMYFPRLLVINEEINS